MPSEKILNDKKAYVAELAEKIKNANVGVIVDYKGISVADATKLRKEMREAGASYQVVKNTLLKRALAEAGVEGLDNLLEGSTAIALGEDYVSAAKALKTYADGSKTFKIKGGFVDGNIIDEEGVKTLASMPSKDEMIAHMLGSLNAPITGLVTVLNGTIKGLVVALNAIAEKQSAQA